MSLRALLLSSKGRISRITYWLSFIGIVLVPVIAVAVLAVINRLGIIGDVGDLGRKITEYIMGGIVLVSLLLIMVVTIKRLHDRDRSWRTLAAVAAVGYAMVWLERAADHWITYDPLINMNRPYEAAYLIGAAPFMALSHTLAPVGAVPAFGTIPKLVKALPGGLLSPAAMYYTIDMLLGFLGVAVGLWYFWEVGLRRGTVGPNRYGPDPLG